MTNPRLACTACPVSLSKAGQKLTSSGYSRTPNRQPILHSNRIIPLHSRSAVDTIFKVFGVLQLGFEPGSLDGHYRYWRYTTNHYGH